MLRTNMILMLAIASAATIAVVNGLDLSTEGFCGEPVARPNLTITAPTTRVVGGTPAVANSYPWNVYISYRNTENNNPSCGGAILTNKWIITTTGCFYGEFENLKEVTVDVGIHNRAREKNKIKVDLVVTHSDFKVETLENDIALLRLASPIQFNNKIRPICLPDKDNAKTPNKAIISGWGVTVLDGNNSDILQQAIVPIRDDCHYEPEINVNLQMCAGDKNPIKAACDGEGGAPLIMRADPRKLKFELVGLVSFLEDENSCGGEGGYTRVFAYRDWIVSAIKNYNLIKV